MGSSRNRVSRVELGIWQSLVKFNLYHSVHYLQHLSHSFTTWIWNMVEGIEPCHTQILHASICQHCVVYQSGETLLIEK